MLDDLCMETMLHELHSTIKGAVKKHPAQALLFSGGLDSSILASIASPISTIHVSLEGTGSDLPYARLMAETFGFDLIVREVSVEEALAAIPEVIRIRRSFDPALPNDLALYFAFTEAKERGFESIMTGDGADELFAGYSYMFDLDLTTYIPWLSERMVFSANELGSWFGIKVSQPFLDQRVVETALAIPPEFKVREENGVRFGKWILRKAFENKLPPKICWQDKRPIEVGSGFARLREKVASLVTEADRTASFQFISADQPYYYRIYREVVGEIPTPVPGQVACPNCGAGMLPNSHHCRICGISILTERR